MGHKLVFERIDGWGKSPCNKSLGDCFLIRNKGRKKYKGWENVWMGDGCRDLDGEENGLSGRNKEWRSFCMHEINNANICGQGGDQWIWCVDSSNKFTVKFTYIALHDRRIGSHEVYEFKFLWQIKISQRVSLFIWRVLHDRLPTKITFIRGTSKFKKRV